MIKTPNSDGSQAHTKQTSNTDPTVGTSKILENLGDSRRLGRRISLGAGRRHRPPPPAGPLADRVARRAKQHAPCRENLRDSRKISGNLGESRRFGEPGRDAGQAARKLPHPSRQNRHFAARAEKIGIMSPSRQIGAAGASRTTTREKASSRFSCAAGRQAAQKKTSSISTTSRVPFLQHASGKIAAGRARPHAPCRGGRACATKDTELEKL